MSILALVSDLVFGSKISATAEHLGIDVRIVRSSADVFANVENAAVVILDLDAGPDVLAMVQQIKLRRPAVRVIGFLPHVQTDLAQQASAAGVDQVLPRSAFTKRLSEILNQAAG